MRMCDNNGFVEVTSRATVWMCDGCKWSLRLKPGSVPPLDHTLNYPIGTPRDQMTDCPYPCWRIIGKELQ